MILHTLVTRNLEGSSIQMQLGREKKAHQRSEPNTRPTKLTSFYPHLILGGGPPPKGVPASLRIRRVGGVDNPILPPGPPKPNSLGTLKFSLEPSVCRLCKICSKIPASLYSKYFLYSLSAVLASSMESCVCFWISDDRTEYARNRRESFLCEFLSA